MICIFRMNNAKQEQIFLRKSVYGWLQQSAEGKQSMERDIMMRLAEWKDSPDRKPLLITGVRQCGKTYVLKEFGSVVRGKKIIPGKTLVIFDEVQACPKALTSLKYFCDNMKGLHIVCAVPLYLLWKLDRYLDVPSEDEK